MLKGPSNLMVPGGFMRNDGQQTPTISSVRMKSISPRDRRRLRNLGILHDRQPRYLSRLRGQIVIYRRNFRTTFAGRSTFL
jgi:hypothetical protein